MHRHCWAAEVSLACFMITGRNRTIKLIMVATCFPGKRMYSFNNLKMGTAAAILSASSGKKGYNPAVRAFDQVMPVTDFNQGQDDKRSGYHGKDGA